MELRRRRRGRRRATVAAGVSARRCRRPIRVTSTATRSRSKRKARARPGPGRFHRLLRNPDQAAGSYTAEMVEPLTEDELTFFQKLLDPARNGAAGTLMSAVDRGVSGDVASGSGDTFLILAA